jgi:hypothetical protein
MWLRSYLLCILIVFSLPATAQTVYTGTINGVPANLLAGPVPSNDSSLNIPGTAWMWSNFLPLRGGTITGTLYLQNGNFSTPDGGYCFGASNVSDPPVICLWSDNATNVHFGDATKSDPSTIALTLSGLTLTGALTGASATFSDAIVSNLESDVSGPAGNFRLNRWETNGSWRFALGLNTTAETGNNAGSDLCLFNYSDAALVLGTPFCVTRATGATTFTAPVQVPTPAAGDSSQNVATTAYVQNALAGILPITGGTMTGNLTVPNVTVGFGLTAGAYVSATMIQATGTGANSGIFSAAGLTVNGPVALGNSSTSTTTILGNVSVGSGTDTGSISVLGPITSSSTMTASLGSFSRGVSPGGFTEDTIPACNAENADLQVVAADASNPTYLAAYKGGGTTIAPVVCNGASGDWITY